MLFLFALGTVFGSFGTVLIARIPVGQSIRGRSRCPRCGAVLSAWQLIPIVSFVLLRGRCASCRERIALWYPLLELASGTLFLAAGSMAGSSVPQGIILGLALWLLLVIAVIDGKTQHIPDALNVPFIIVAAAVALGRGGVDWVALFLGIGFFGAQWLFSRGRWVGSGDVLLAAGLGILLPQWKTMALAITIAYVLGAFVAASLLLTGRKERKDVMAFGPFLATGGVVALLFGGKILQAFGM